MKLKISQIEDEEEARELHELSFPGDSFPGAHHTYWVARDEQKKLAGFASALITDYGACFLSRAAVAAQYQGRGLHKRLIRHRLRWAKRQGASYACTYTVAKNYPSILNLLGCGFRFYEPDEFWAGQSMHYLRKDL